MIEKRNVLEASRTVCDYCGNKAVKISPEGMAVCHLHDIKPEKAASYIPPNSGKIPAIINKAEQLINDLPTT